MKTISQLAAEPKHSKLLLVLIIFPIIYAVVISCLFFIRADSFKFLSSDNLQKTNTLVIANNSEDNSENSTLIIPDSVITSIDSPTTEIETGLDTPLELPTIETPNTSRVEVESSGSAYDNEEKLYFNMDSLEISNSNLVAALAETEDMLELHYKPNQHYPNSHMVYKSLLGRLKTGSQDSLHFKKIIILGFTDNKGSKEVNLYLCQIRANIIKQIFVKNGYPANLIEIGCFADQLPIDTNLTEEGRFRNRRIEINILKNLIPNEITEIQNR